MQQNSFASLTRQRLIALCLLYGAILLYSSTIIGPSGINFVYRDPVEAFRTFLQTPYVAHGSDQRPDWIGNLLMLIPFGFLVAGAIWPRRSTGQLPAATAAVLICVAVILAVKYLQLYFPPRTVTLNYIIAQSLGAVIGCGAWVVWRTRLVPSTDGRDPVERLILALRLYASALFLFVLMPLDFALDAVDLSMQLDRLPDTLMRLPGTDRPLILRTVMITVAVLAFAPVGMLLTFVWNGTYRVSRSIGAVAALGLLITTSLYGLATLVISAYPVLPSILYRTFGILMGAAALRWLSRQDADALRMHLRRLVPWAVLPYLLSVLLVNHLLSLRWLSLPAAIAQAYPLGLLPLFDYYIVSKAEAAKNVVGHFALYLPVGVLLRLRHDTLSNAKIFVWAATLSLLMELGRYFRPGLEGDINAVFIAGLAAVVAAQVLPALWQMIRLLGACSIGEPRDFTDRGHGRMVAGPSIGGDYR